MATQRDTRTSYRNRRTSWFILAAAAVSLALYAWIATAGDLREAVPAFLAAHALLLLLMMLVWALARRQPGSLRLVLWAALVFRLVASIGQPALSDDVYRYVWDGKVQTHGIHPYLHAPDSEELQALRDADWSRINHPRLKTIYPPLAEMLFAALSALGAGPVGFKLALGLIDFAVVLAVAFLLRRLRLPPARVVLYAWNPLAVVESAGSGHVEPLGVLAVVLAAGWIIDRRRSLSTIALAAGIAAKLMPLALVPGYVRRLPGRVVLLLALVVALFWLPYALWGPGVGAGLFDYADRWEHNSVIFALVLGTLEFLNTGELLKPWVSALRDALGDGVAGWEAVYRLVWPDRLARVVVALAAMAWIAWLAFRRHLGPVRESFLVLAGVLLLSPTLHPWYVLWVLPFAALLGSRAWLLLAALIPLSYLATDGEVSWALRAAWFLPPLALGLWDWSRREKATSSEIQTF